MRKRAVKAPWAGRLAAQGGAGTCCFTPRSSESMGSPLHLRGLGQCRFPLRLSCVVCRVGELRMKTLTIKQVAQARMRESIRVSEDLLKGGQLRTLEAVARILVESFQRGKKVIFFGNGGSAADAQHFAAEFVGKFHLQRPALAALALTVDISALTAIGNDLSFDVVFSRQL